MTKYEKVYEILQNQVNEGYLPVEEAVELNDLAYEKYGDDEFEDDDDFDMVELPEHIQECVDEGYMTYEEGLEIALESGELDEDEEDDPMEIKRQNIYESVENGDISETRARQLLDLLDR